MVESDPLHLEWVHTSFLSEQAQLIYDPVRLAGGPIIIVLEHNPQNIGLIIAALILLGVGTIPLLVADLGYVKMLWDTFYVN